MPLSVLILAAGKGTRMNSNYPKVLHNVGNIPMIYYSIDLAQKLIYNCKFEKGCGKTSTFWALH